MRRNLVQSCERWRLSRSLSPAADVRPDTLFWWAPGGGEGGGGGGGGVGGAGGGGGGGEGAGGEGGDGGNSFEGLCWWWEILLLGKERQIIVAFIHVATFPIKRKNRHLSNTCFAEKSDNTVWLMCGRQEALILMKHYTHRDRRVSEELTWGERSNVKPGTLCRRTSYFLSVTMCSREYLLDALHQNCVGIQVDPVDPPGKTWNGVETLHCTVFACTPPRQLREVRKKRPGAFSAVCSRTEWGGVGRALVCEVMCALAVIERAVWSKVECDRMVRSAGKAGIIPLYWAGVANFTKTNIYPMPHASTHQQHSDAFNPTMSHWTTRSTSLLWPSFQKRILDTLQVFWQGEF